MIVKIAYFVIRCVVDVSLSTSSVHDYQCVIIVVNWRLRVIRCFEQFKHGLTVVDSLRLIKQSSTFSLLTLRV